MMGLDGDPIDIWFVQPHIHDQFELPFQHNQDYYESF